MGYSVQLIADIALEEQRLLEPAISGGEKKMTISGAALHPPTATGSQTHTLSY